MTYIAQSPVVWHGVNLAYYIVEQSRSGYYYVWRTDLKMRKIRNVGSYPRRADAIHMAAIYAAIASEY